MDTKLDFQILFNCNMHSRAYSKSQHVFICQEFTSDFKKNRKFKLTVSISAQCKQIITEFRKITILGKEYNIQRIHCT